MNRNALIGLVLAGTAAFGGWYYGSPLYAMNQLRNAAQDGDEAALEERVDFPALRDDLKQEVSARMAQELASAPDNPLGKMGAAFGMALIGPMIDGFVTPAMVAKVVREGKAGTPGEDAGDSGEEEGKEVDWQIERDGLSGFIARPVNSDGEKGPELEFTRDGLSWRLVGINLPENAPAPDANTI